MPPCFRLRGTLLRMLGAVCLLLALVRPAAAHVGSNDVFEQMQAGPYKLFITIRPPMVVPGVAVVEIRTSGPEVRAIHITPVPMVGEASRHPPTPDEAQRSAVDPAFFTGSVWLMATGSWKVELALDGAAGQAFTSVPVPALPLAVRGMDRGLGGVLAVMGLVLLFGIAGIAAAATRESRLPPGVQPPPSLRRRGLVAGAVTFAVAAIALGLGGVWWHAAAAEYALDVYKPLALQATLAGSSLHLTIGSRGAETRSSQDRTVTGLLPDHGHPMHLYAIREPGMDAVYHLHPAEVAPGELRTALPTLPAGRYRLFADIVHRNGLPETLTASLEIPVGFQGVPLDSEDAAARPQPLSAGALGGDDALPDGYRMVWDKPASLAANQPILFRFRLLNREGTLATDVAPYLGMAGHAAFVKTDWTVFAHTHPEGSAPMPALMLANSDGAAGVMEMPSGQVDATPLPATVEFPYGFPSAGRYRIFVQMKHGATVETGVFDADVH